MRIPKVLGLLQYEGKQRDCRGCIESLGYNGFVSQTIVIIPYLVDFLWDYLCPHSGFSIGKVFHFVINSLYQYLYYFIVLLVCVCGIFFFFF